jgi:hypothetical protein
MWNRACPRCFVRPPRTTILACSDEWICPSCHTALEVSRPSRVFAAFLGVIAAYLSAETVAVVMPRAAWFLPAVAAGLAYGAVSALVLYLAADLVVQAKPLAPAFPHAQE